jgi:hemerythrin-like domain-containing protein
MCEYCGCLEIPAIAELTREHDAAVDLIAEVRAAHAAGDTPQMVRLAKRIAVVLEPHTEVEEHGLFPAMAGEFPDQIAALEAEHRRMEAVLGEATGGAPVDATWPERFIDALAVLRDHILKEQDGVFPAALTSLGPAEWEAVDAVRTRVGSTLPQPSYLDSP